jgi:hypothetical protein
MAKMQEQTRAGGQVDENKQAVSVEGQESKAEEQGPGVENQGSVVPAAEEGTSDPAAGATEPVEEPQTA